MYLSEKSKVLDKLNREMKTAAVKCHYGVNKVKIHSINKNKDYIRGSIKAIGPMSVKISCKLLQSFH